VKHEIQPEEELWRQVIENKALDPFLVAEFRATSESKPWKPIGQILLELKLLGAKQLMNLLAIQALEPELRLGDLAVREKYCTEADIERALELQRGSATGAIEMMLRDDRIENELLINALVGYVHHLEGAIYNLRHEIAKGRASAA